MYAIVFKNILLTYVHCWKSSISWVMIIKIRSYDSVTRLISLELRSRVLFVCRVVYLRVTDRLITGLALYHVNDFV